MKDTLGIGIGSLVLDAGYVMRELVERYHIGVAEKMTARMPARKGFPYKALYHDVKQLFIAKIRR